MRIIYLYIFFSYKNEKEECHTFAKFKIKEIDGKKRYTFLTLQLVIKEKKDLYIGTCTENTGNQLEMSDFMQDLSINPN